MGIYSSFCDLRPSLAAGLGMEEADMPSQEEILKADMARARLACALVAYAYGAENASLDGGRHPRRMSFIRQVAMYLLHVGFGMSLARVAHAFGRDRSTAAYACHRVEDARDDPDFDSRVEALEEALRSAPSPAPARP